MKELLALLLTIIVLILPYIGGFYFRQGGKNPFNVDDPFDIIFDWFIGFVFLLVAFGIYLVIYKAI